MLLLSVCLQQQENRKLNMLPLRPHKSWSLNHWSPHFRACSLVDISTILFDFEWPCRLVVPSCKSYVTHSIVLGCIFLGCLVCQGPSQLKSQVTGRSHSHNNFSFSLRRMDHHLLRLDLQRKHRILRMGNQRSRIPKILKEILYFQRAS